MLLLLRKVALGDRTAFGVRPNGKCDTGVLQLPYARIAIAGRCIKVLSDTAKGGSAPEPVGHYGRSLRCEHAFGVKLDAVHIVLAVAQGHDIALIALGSHL